LTLLIGQQERRPACTKLCCWWWRFDRSFARIRAPVITKISIILSSSKSRMLTFWYWLTQVHLE